MIIAVLFTIAKVWKQPKCPSTDEWIMQRVGHERKTEHMHTPTFHIMEYLLLPSSHYVVSDSFANPSLSGFSVPGKNTGVGCHFLLQGIFSSQPRDQTCVSCLAGRFFIRVSITCEAQWNTDQP